jgi:membrane-associated phospholipid phosphatase
MLSYIDLIGFYGPWIQGIINVTQLITQQYYLIGYLIFAYINVFTNKWLKLHYKEPRPSNKEESGIPIKIEDPDIFGMPNADIYGFPSGHAQQLVYSVFYLYFVKRSPLLLFLGIFLTGLTVYQRWNFKRHSIKQLAYGSLIGALMGYIGYFITSRVIKSIYSLPVKL